MRIGIEAQRIFRPHKHGMDRVAIEVIKKLQEIDKLNEYFVFVKDDTDTSVISESANFTIVKMKSYPYPYWEQIQLVREARKYNLDLLHCTNNTAPLYIEIPLVVTIHDIIYMESLNMTKGTSYQILGNLYRRWNVSRIAHRADRILTVSEFERENISTFFNFSGDRVITVCNGVSEHFFEIKPQEELKKIRERYALPLDYVLYLGNPDPRKNLDGVLKAMSILQNTSKLTFNLVILGLKKNAVEKACWELGVPKLIEHIKFPGYISDEDLPAIYSLAKLFLYPSLREGFGMPIIEAMASQTPVITSNTSSMPEVAGEAGLLINPFDAESIAAGVYFLFNDVDHQQMLVKAGVEQAKKFTWTANARKTLKIYEEVSINFKNKG